MRYLKFTLLCALVFTSLGAVEFEEDYLKRPVTDTARTPVPTWTRGMRCLAPMTQNNWMGRNFCADLTRKPLVGTRKKLIDFGDNDCEEFIQDINKNLTIDNFFVSCFKIWKLVTTRGIEHKSAPLAPGRTDFTGELATFIEKAHGIVGAKGVGDIGVLAFVETLKAFKANTKRPEVATGGQPLHISLEESKTGRQQAYDLKLKYFQYRVARISDFRDEFDKVSDFIIGKDIFIQKMRFSSIKGKKILFKDFDNNDTEEFLQAQKADLMADPTRFFEIACESYKVLMMKGINKEGIPQTINETYNIIVELDKIAHDKPSESDEWKAMKKILMVVKTNKNEPTDPGTGQPLHMSLDTPTSRSKMYNLKNMYVWYRVVTDVTEFPGFKLDTTFISGKPIPIQLVRYSSVLKREEQMSVWTPNDSEEWLQDQIKEIDADPAKFFEVACEFWHWWKWAYGKKILKAPFGKPDSYDEAIELLLKLETIASAKGSGSAEWTAMRRILGQAKRHKFDYILMNEAGMTKAIRTAVDKQRERESKQVKDFYFKYAPLSL